ncbi:T-cell differentiation antigen CD6 [Heterocephalus glaber]|uniref:T-cell differentiation antigen CD6 n=1 Tax=Heterocephalus glaber TaxID=10181 RepID=G5AYE7_HETGA|nr:T-cell differentiation antigen CD6 [Heterocephalus glaber]
MVTLRKVRRKPASSSMLGSDPKLGCLTPGGWATEPSLSQPVRRGLEKPGQGRLCPWSPAGVTRGSWPPWSLPKAQPRLQPFHPSNFCCHGNHSRAPPGPGLSEQRAGGRAEHRLGQERPCVERKQPGARPGTRGLLPPATPSPGQHNASSKAPEPGAWPGLRLANSSSHCLGEVQVRLGATWAPVCGAQWDQQAAEAVCRALGCGGAEATPEPEPGSPVGNTSVTNATRGPALTIWCQGPEWSLCEVVEDACGIDVSPASVTCTEARALRLVGGGSACAGRVEMLEGGAWGTVCDDAWDLQDAHVACRQLGCGWAVEAAPGLRFPAGRGPIHRDVVTCGGHEAQLWDCEGRPGGYCGHKEDAGVVCSEHQSWRLTGGGDRCDGQVEVQFRGVWSTVCDSAWYRPEADVLCRALGCGLEVDRPPGQAHSLPGRMFYSCTGEEAAPSLCTWRFNNSNLCSQSRAARVLCSVGAGQGIRAECLAEREPLGSPGRAILETAALGDRIAARRPPRGRAVPNTAAPFSPASDTEAVLIVSQAASQESEKSRRCWSKLMVVSDVARFPDTTQPVLLPRPIERTASDCRRGEGQGSCVELSWVPSLEKARCPRADAPASARPLGPETEPPGKSPVVVETEGKGSRDLVLLIPSIVLGVLLLGALVSVALLLLRVKGKYALPAAQNHRHLLPTATPAESNSYHAVAGVIPKEEVPQPLAQGRAVCPKDSDSSSGSDYEHYDFSAQPPMALTTFYNSQRYRVTEEEAQQSRFRMPPLEEGLEELQVPPVLAALPGPCATDAALGNPQRRHGDDSGSSTSSGEDYSNSPSSKALPWSLRAFPLEQSPGLELAGPQMPFPGGGPPEDNSSSTSSGEWYQNFRSPPQAPSTEQFECPGPPSPQLDSSSEDYDDISAA